MPTKTWGTSQLSVPNRTQLLTPSAAHHGCDSTSDLPVARPSLPRGLSSASSITEHHSKIRQNGSGS